MGAELRLSWPQVSDGSLTVTSVSREDRGAYTCRAYSIQGEAVHTTHLLVQGKRDISSPFVPRAFFRDLQPSGAKEGLPWAEGSWQVEVGGPSGAGWASSQICVPHGWCSCGSLLWPSRGWHEAPCWVDFWFLYLSR